MVARNAGKNSLVKNNSPIFAKIPLNMPEKQILFFPDANDAGKGPVKLAEPLNGKPGTVVLDERGNVLGEWVDSRTLTPEARALEQRLWDAFNFGETG